MGMRSGGVLTVSNVGVSAVTYMPYSGKSEISVVTIKSRPRPRTHDETATAT